MPPPSVASLPNPLRVALVGCGEVCEHKHLPALARVPSVQVVALVDPDPARLAAVGTRFGIAARFADVGQLVSECALDAAGILTPPGAHVDTALCLLAAGHHVLVEKPLALTLLDADRLPAAAAVAGPRVLMGHHMRWHRLVLRAREAIRAGAVGTVESVRTTWNSPRPDAGIPEWKRRRTSGGGVLLELGVHLFDLWRFLLDTEVAQVTALSHHGVRDDEHAVVTATLADGTLAVAMLSERTGHEIEIEVSGDRGRICVACQRFDGYRFYARAETRGMLGPRLRDIGNTLRTLPQGLAGLRRLGDYGDSYAAMWRHFAQVVARGADPLCVPADGRAALKVALAAAASSADGRWTRVADASLEIAGARGHGS